MARINIYRIVEHIDTSAGPRFAVYRDDEDRRVQLIQYYNEVHATEGVDDFDDDAELSEVEGAIEEIEDVSTEEIWIEIDTDEIHERLLELADQKHEAQMMDAEEPSDEE